jgi:hypothetical protein
MPYQLLEKQKALPYKQNIIDQHVFVEKTEVSCEESLVQFYMN